MLSLNLRKNLGDSIYYETRAFNNTLREAGIDPRKHRWAIVPDVDGSFMKIDLYSYVPDETTRWTNAEVEFFLYTRKEKHKNIKPRRDSISRSSFNKDHPTRFTIHGWLGDETSAVNRNVIEQYLLKGDYNCIMVDWTSGSSRCHYIYRSMKYLFKIFVANYAYIPSRLRVKDVGYVVAKFVDFLQTERLIEMEDLYIIGHSLG